MKNIFTCLAMALAVALLLPVNATAQNCVIDTTNYEFITPSSDELPCIVRGEPYFSAIQFYCPPAIAGVNIDSIRVSGFSGLPNGISYQCNPTICKAYPFSRMCIAVSGITNDTAGDYNVIYSGTAYTSQGNISLGALQNQGFLPQYSYYVIDTGVLCRGQDTTTTGIINNAVAKGLLRVYPNPAKSVFYVEAANSQLVTGEITVTNLLGAVVYRLPVSSTLRTAVDMAQQPKGMYLVHLPTTQGVQVTRVLLE